MVMMERLQIEEEIALTYAKGNPIGFSGGGVSSSIFINAGASGSPVLNEKEQKVVGILSNGAITLSSDNGNPSIFRTLYKIENDFHISEHLNGILHKKIYHYIKVISQASSPKEVKIILEKYNLEKTYFGEARLKVLSYNHHLPAVRKLLVKFLDQDRDSNW